MARNEEKHLGKLNRLWLQKEREEGRIKDVHEARPRLSSLNTAAAVKKWIPSIKNEIEFYLQQSQLSHYPERKIAEFQQNIEELGEEYKRYIRKLRFLDPSCKHHPWTPRAYTKRRQEDGHQCAAKRLCTTKSSGQPSKDSAVCDGFSRSRDDAISQNGLPDQDQPLSFNTTRMALKLAGSRLAPSGLHSAGMTRVLLSGLPNLHSTCTAQPAVAQGTACLQKGATEPLDPSLVPQSKPHDLGLGCYSSSDDDT
ncbi:hypothetical protein AGOR_G00149830 [Albula goreensis]|uniref:Uncharacterized protein n=1 Tax=Albula goreensis TaxID=1534307 RepID=A0A8T3D8S7_9TELE|nr:hypothetical protein AGOR_G00149830 [Albula goreensis]